MTASSDGFLKPETLCCQQDVLSPATSTAIYGSDVARASPFEGDANDWSRDRARVIRQPAQEQASQTKRQSHAFWHGG